VPIQVHHLLSACERNVVVADGFLCPRHLQQVCCKNEQKMLLSLRAGAVKCYIEVATSFLMPKAPNDNRWSVLTSRDA